MSRWKNVVRGVLGMGLTFGAIAGAFFSVLAVIAFLLGAEDEPGFMVIAGSVWGFAIGVSFSGVLALASRGRSFEELSLRRVAALGAAGGLALATVLVALTWQEWPNGNAIVPFTMLPLLGAGAATASLLVARKARPKLPEASGERHLGEGEVDAST